VRDDRAGNAEGQEVEEPVRPSQIQQALAADLPALWQAATRGSDRRPIVRLLIDRVELTRWSGTELVDLVVHWRGGARGRHVIRQLPAIR
jgi:hypothetical protein